MQSVCFDDDDACAQALMMFGLDAVVDAETDRKEGVGGR